MVYAYTYGTGLLDAGPRRVPASKYRLRPVLRVPKFTGTSRTTLDGQRVRFWRSVRTGVGPESERDIERRNYSGSDDQRSDTRRYRYRYAVKYAQLTGASLCWSYGSDTVSGCLRGSSRMSGGRMWTADNASSSVPSVRPLNAAKRPKPEEVPPFLKDAPLPSSTGGSREPSAKAKELAERVLGDATQNASSSYRTRLEKFYRTDDPLQLTQKQANEVLVINGRIVMSVDAVKRAITAKLCQQAGRPYGTGTWSHGMEPGTFICRYCGLDPLGSLQAARDREAEIVERVGGPDNVLKVGGRPAMWEAEMQADGLLTDDNRVDVDDPFGRAGDLSDSGLSEQRRLPRTRPLLMPDRWNGWKHGTASGYKNHGCRCDPCRHAGC